MSAKDNSPHGLLEDQPLTLTELLRWAHGHVMSDEEREEQRRSFAYGNARIANRHVTREMVDRIADECQR